MKIKIIQARDGKWTAQFVAGNNEIVWTTSSQRYNRKRDAVAAVTLLHDAIFYKSRAFLVDQIQEVTKPKGNKTPCKR